MTRLSCANVIKPESNRITCEGALKLNAPVIAGDEVWASSAFMEVGRVERRTQAPRRSLL